MREGIFEEIKDLMEITGGKYVIIEDGRPKYVLMKFDEYRELGEKIMEKSRSDDFSEANAVLEELKTEQPDDYAPSASAGNVESSDLPF